MSDDRYKHCYVFIDYGYLKLIAKELNAPKYDINQFAITLSKNEKLWCEQVYFYTAPPYQSANPTEDEKIRKANYDKFITHLHRIPTIVVREGRCQKINNEFKQKGVDTLLTMDLSDVKGSKIKEIIIITSDTDFVPVLNNLREKDINVILYHYTDKIRNSRFSMSNHLSRACDKQVQLDITHFTRSIKQNKDLLPPFTRSC